MGKISELLGRTVSTADYDPQHAFSPPPPGQPRPNGNNANGNGVHHAETVSPQELSAQLGEDNEALRRLLAETGHKISELEEFKASFASVVEPAHKALRALENEKTQNIRLQRSLSATQAGHETLQAKFSDLEKEAARLAVSNQELRRELEKAHEATREVKGAKAEIANEFAVARARIVDLERQLSHELANVRGLTEDNKHLHAQTVEAESRVGPLEAELAALREKHGLLEGDHRAAQTSLDQTQAAVAGLTQRHSDGEAALTAAKAQLAQLQAALTEAERVRDKLTLDLKEVNERYHADSARLDRQVEALQARVGAGDKLLLSTRQLLASRSEEARLAERKSRDAAFAHETAEKKSDDLKTTIEQRDQQIAELDKARSELQERATTLDHGLQSVKTQLAQTEERLRTTAERITQLEADGNIGRVRYERRIEELNELLEEERLQRQVGEGALAAARRHDTELQIELSKLRAAQRREEPPEPTRVQAAE